MGSGKHMLVDILLSACSCFINTRVDFKIEKVVKLRLPIMSSTKSCNPRTFI